jgi:hypothetical protein
MRPPAGDRRGAGHRLLPASHDGDGHRLLPATHRRADGGVLPGDGHGPVHAVLPAVGHRRGVLRGRGRHTVLRDVVRSHDTVLHPRPVGERRGVDRCADDAVLPDGLDLPATPSASATPALHHRLLRRQHRCQHRRRDGGRRDPVLPPERDVRPAPLLDDDLQALHPVEADRLPPVTRPLAA